MVKTEVNYRSLSESNRFRNTNEDAELVTINDNEDTPINSGIMIHIVPETNKARWNHIEDLDSFFTRMYNYHQKHGFTVIVMDEIFQLCEFGFVVWLLTFTVYCINHSVLFGNSLPPSQAKNNKVTLNDVIIPIGQCVKNFEGITYLILFIATLYFMIRFIKMIYHISQYMDIKKFYNTALHIEDIELDNITWHDVKKKIREVQSEQYMCIDKEQLTELDICHRILRFKNYMVALMNKNLLPVRYNIPVIGEVVALSRGLLINIDFILFRGPGSPFQNNWQLRDDYTVRSNQIELAQRLSKLILWVAIANFVLAPIIFLWQLIYFCFSYANILRKEPGALGMRTWSNYGRLYLRHFNELEHELDARLNRAYEYADRYLSSFSSPLMAVIAKNLLFISGGILVLILALGIYEEYVFQVEHVLTIITALSAVGLVCRTLIPDENLIWCPEQLMTAILAHVHYIPTDWKNQAHTTKVRKEFSSFFQFKAGYLLNEICSPLITPFILLFVFRPKALEIVKFFRSFTVTVRGVGNVCSFAQMDVRKHGNPEWQLQNSLAPESGDEPENLDIYTKKDFSVENGKTELSLVRFNLTNPEWQMPPDAIHFIKGIRENAIQELLNSKKADNNITLNPITESLLSFGTIGEKYSSIATSVFMAHNIPSSVIGNSYHQSFKSHAKIPVSQRMTHSIRVGFEQMPQQNLDDPTHDPSFSANLPTTSQHLSETTGPIDSMRKMRVCKAEGRLEGPNDSLLYSLYGLDPRLSKNSTDITVADMCLSTLYLHELHKRNKKVNPGLSTDTEPGTSRQAQQIITSNAAETTPLLRNINS